MHWVVETGLIAEVVDGRGRWEAEEVAGEGNVGIGGDEVGVALYWFGENPTH